ncbi:V-type proton ATPase subunit E [Diutina catenulata]
MSLSDEQVKSELAKMQGFIKKEAEEKAKEIRLKADEEYEIEKASIVRSESAAIDASYQQKLKKASLAQQIQKSTLANKTRLRILGTKEEVLEDLFEDAAKELEKLVKDDKRYGAVLALLIEEGLLALLEPTVNVNVRKVHVDLAKKVVDDAKKAYKDKSGKDVEVKINEGLEDKVIGGAVITNKDGKISVDNTLTERLALLNQGALPAIRLELFGISESRKFFD